MRNCAQGWKATCVLASAKPTNMLAENELPQVFLRGVARGSDIGRETGWVCEGWENPAGRATARQSHMPEKGKELP